MITDERPACAVTANATERRPATATSAASARDPLAVQAAPALAAITGTARAARVRFLGDDAPGERGYAIAARYVANPLWH
jgi:hypothetical protein